MPSTILEIIKLSLEITLEVIKGIPVQERQAMWAQHQKDVEFWQKLFEKLQG